MKVRPRLAVAFILAVIAGWFAYSHVPAPLPELSRSELLAEVRAGHVRKVIIEDHQVITGESSTRGPFRSAYKEPQDAHLVTELRAQGVEVVFESSPLGLNVSPALRRHSHRGRSVRFLQGLPSGDRQLRACPE